jgi:hypothetical protein
MGQPFIDVSPLRRQGFAHPQSKLNVEQSLLEILAYPTLPVEVKI